MLKEMEYLGFAMRSPEGVYMYVFDVTPEGVMTYGPYPTEGTADKRTTLEEAVVVSISFEDGTMPIHVSEFNDRLNAGESWERGSYNLFPQTHFVGVTSMFSKRLKSRVPLHIVREREGDKFFVAMFEQCIQCYTQHIKENENKTKMMVRARKVYDKNLSDMETFFTDEKAYRSFKGLIIDLLDEAYNTADAKLVDFILEQNDKLEKKGVAVEKRSARISRAATKKCHDDFVALMFPKKTKAA